MSTIKSGLSLRSLLLTPERIPDFCIPSRSPRLILSPHRSSPDRVRLLSGHYENSPGASPPEVSLSPAASPRFRLRLSPRVRIPRRSAVAAAESADTDVTTRAAMSLQHVEKLTAPYGFRAVLVASPRTHRRESLFHRNKPITVTATETQQLPLDGPSPGPGRSRVCCRPVNSLGLQVMRGVKMLSPAPRRSQRSQDQ